MPLVAFLVPLLAFFVGTSLASIVFRVFSLLGVGLITYVGGGLFIDSAITFFLSFANQIPSEHLAVLGYVGFDTAVKMLFSAWTIRFTVSTARAFLGVRST